MAAAPHPLAQGCCHAHRPTGSCAGFAGHVHRELHACRRPPHHRPARARASPTWQATHSASDASPGWGRAHRRSRGGRAPSYRNQDQQSPVRSRKGAVGLEKKPSKGGGRETGRRDSPAPNLGPRPPGRRLVRGDRRRGRGWGPRLRRRTRVRQAAGAPRSNGAGRGRRRTCAKGQGKGRALDGHRAGRRRRKGLGAREGGVRPRAQEGAHARHPGAREGITGGRRAWQWVVE